MRNLSGGGLEPTRAAEAPAAREARRPHFVRRRASKPAGALHRGVAPKGPRFRLLIGVIALLREALHCLVASALLAYLVHRFL